MIFLSSSGTIVNVKSKLGPEIGFVMAWPTHPPTTIQLFFSCKLLIKVR